MIRKCFMWYQLSHFGFYTQGLCLIWPFFQLRFPDLYNWFKTTGLAFLLHLVCQYLLGYNSVRLHMHSPWWVLQEMHDNIPLLAQDSPPCFYIWGWRHCLLSLLYFVPVGSSSDLSWMITYCKHFLMKRFP